MSTIAHTFPVAAARPARRPAGQLRLTRRGRVVVGLLALGLVAGMFLFWSAGSVASPEGGTDAPTTVLTVGTGETLWGIASEISEGRDVRGTMRQIERLNALESSMLVAGQRLRVPVG